MCFLDINKQILKFIRRQKTQNNQDNIKKEQSWRTDITQLQDSLQKSRQTDINQRTNRYFCKEMKRAKRAKESTEK